MKIDGGCHCGGIRFEAEIDPRRVVICHCTDCQTMSGAPYRVNAPVRAEDFSLTGEPRQYVKTGSSGAAIVTTFCGTCGSPIYSKRPDQGQFLNVRLGGVTQRAQLTPRLQGFCDSAMPWAFDIRDVPKAPERR